MRAWLLLACSLVWCTAARADQVPDDAGEAGTWTGLYRFHDEKSEFKPQGTKEYWWVTGEIDRLKRIYLAPDKKPTGYQQPVYVVLRGTLIRGGRHGWYGNYSNQLTVEEIVELQRFELGEQPRF